MGAFKEFPWNFARIQGLFIELLSDKDGKPSPLFFSPLAQQGSRGAVAMY